MQLPQVPETWQRIRNAVTRVTPRRYSAGARFYDVLSGERWVYRAGRERGIELLGVRFGDTVLDLGCGTGLNFPYLVAAVGASGRVIGLDRSADMLAVAQRRIDAHGWRNVTLVSADATAFSSRDLGMGMHSADVHAVFSTYAMSVFPDWRAAWACAKSVLTPDARACIVDMQLPSGAAALLAPLARLACATGGADINAHPWTALEQDGKDVVADTRRGGHIRITAATIR